VRGCRWRQRAPGRLGQGSPPLSKAHKMKTLNFSQAAPKVDTGKLLRAILLEVLA
jgi:hypothetical protein